MHQFAAPPTPPPPPEATARRRHRQSPRPHTPRKPPQALARGHSARHRQAHPSPSHQNPMHQSAPSPPTMPAYQNPLHLFPAAPSPPSRPACPTAARAGDGSACNSASTRVPPRAPSPRPTPDMRRCYKPQPGRDTRTKPQIRVSPNPPHEPRADRGTRAKPQIHVFPNQPSDPGPAEAPTPAPKSTSLRIDPSSPGPPSACFMARMTAPSRQTDGVTQSRSSASQGDRTRRLPGTAPATPPGQSGQARSQRRRPDVTATARYVPQPPHATPCRFC